MFNFTILLKLANSFFRKPLKKKTKKNMESSNGKAKNEIAH